MRLLKKIWAIFSSLFCFWGGTNMINNNQWHNWCTVCGIFNILIFRKESDSSFGVLSWAAQEVPQELRQPASSSLPFRRKHIINLGNFEHLALSCLKIIFGPETVFFLNSLPFNFPVYRIISCEVIKHFKWRQQYNVENSMSDYLWIMGPFLVQFWFLENSYRSQVLALSLQLDLNQTQKSLSPVSSCHLVASAVLMFPTTSPRPRALALSFMVWTAGSDAPGLLNSLLTTLLSDAEEQLNLSEPMQIFIYGI